MNLFILTTTVMTDHEEIDGVVFELTCEACPEQYDAFIDGQKIGYLRLRNGYFRVDYLGATVYAAEPEGDGIFKSEERNFYLRAAAHALKLKHSEIYADT